MQNLRLGALALLVLAACARQDSAPPAASNAAGKAAERGGADASVPTPRPAGEGGAAGEAGRSPTDAAVSGTGGRSGSAAVTDASVPDAMAGGGGGKAGAAGRAGAMSPVAAGPYQCDAKLAANPPDPGGEGAEGSGCCADLGSCQRRGSISLDIKASLAHDSCKAGSGDDDLRCVPKASMHGGVCRANTGGAALEGRCLPRCLLAGNPSALLLTTTDCGGDDAQVCAACFDPVSGQATGACTLQPGDHPSEPAPAPFKDCGSYKKSGGAPAGTCMPKMLATASGNPVVATLPKDVCGDSEVCVPKLKATDFNACFKHCETSVIVQAAGSKEGGCIPPYIAANSNPDAVTFLERGACAEGEVCAPCLDPTKDFAVSGACE